MFYFFRCVQLSECKPFMWLVRNVENLPPGTNAIKLFGCNYLSTLDSAWKAHCSYSQKSFPVLISQVILNQESKCSNSWGQCDQMARLFFQYLAIYNDENLTRSIQKVPNKGSQLCQISNKPLLKCCQRFLNVCQIGEISPNLVTQVEV